MHVVIFLRSVLKNSILPGKTSCNNRQHKTRERARFIWMIGDNVLFHGTAGTKHSNQGRFPSHLLQRAVTVLWSSWGCRQQSKGLPRTSATHYRKRHSSQQWAHGVDWPPQKKHCLITRESSRSQHSMRALRQRDVPRCIVLSSFLPRTENVPLHTHTGKTAPVFLWRLPGQEPKANGVNPFTSKIKQVHSPNLLKRNV